MKIEEVNELVKTIIRDTCTHWIVTDEKGLNETVNKLTIKLIDIIINQSKLDNITELTCGDHKNFLSPYLKKGECIICNKEIGLTDRKNK